MRDYKPDIVDFIARHRAGIEALLYLATPPDQPRKNWIRRRQLENWILREVGADTLAAQMAAANASESGDEQTELTRRAEKLKPLWDFLKERLGGLPVPVDYTAYLAKVEAAAADTPEALAEMLATAGGILVYGTPENTRLAAAEIEHVQTMKRSWTAAMKGKPQIYFTGFPAAARQAMTEKAVAAGMWVTEDMTENMAYLVCGPRAGQKKIDKARGMDTVIMTAAAFDALLETGEIVRMD